MRRALPIYLTALLVVGIGAALVAPFLLQEEAERRVRSALQRRGVSATWSSFEWVPPGTVRLTDARVRAPSRGLTLAADLLEVDVPLRSVVAGAPRVERVELAGADVEVDVALLRPSSAAPAVAERADPRPRALPSIIARAVDVRVRRDGAPLGRLRIERGVLTSDGGLGFEGEGTARPALAALPASLRVEQRWRARGRFVDGRLEASVSGGDAPLLALFEPDLGHLRVESVELRGRPDTRRGELVLRGLEAGTPGLEADVDAVSLRRADGPLMIHVEGADLTLDARLRRNGRASAAVTAGSGGGRRAALEAMLRAATISASGVRATWRRAKGAVTLVDELDGLWVDDRLSLGGAAFGGTFDFTAAFHPGVRRPHHVELRLESFDPARLLRLRPRSTPLQRDASRVVGGRLRARITAVAAGAGLEHPVLGGPTVFDLDLGVEDGFVHHPKVANEAIEDIRGDARAVVRWWPARERLEVLDGRADYGPARARFAARVQTAREDPVIDLEAALDEVACDAVLQALPAGLLGPYVDTRMSGRFAPRTTLHLPLRRPAELAFELEGLLRRCTVTSMNIAREARPPVRLPAAAEADLSDVRWLNEAFVKRVTEGVSEGADVTVGPGVAGYVPLGALPRYVGAAAYLSEEMGFYGGASISKGLIKRALRLNLEHGRYVYGGSTVTQQLVKNLFLKREKTLARKFREALIAARVTDVVSKDRVLELYLNCIEFGPDVYGVGRAARYYFGKDARLLTPSEAVFLAMLKPAPRRGATYKRRGQTPTHPYWLRRSEELMTRLVDKGFITQAQLDAERPFTLRWDEGGRYRGRLAEGLVPVYD